MKKIILAFLAACGNTNPATVMVKAQVPEAHCVDRGTEDGISISICTLPSKQKIVAVYSVAYPFQYLALKTGKEEAPPPPPTPDAGVPSGEGSGSKGK